MPYVCWQHGNIFVKNPSLSTAILPMFQKKRASSRPNSSRTGSEDVVLLFKKRFHTKSISHSTRNSSYKQHSFLSSSAMVFEGFTLIDRFNTARNERLHYPCNHFEASEMLAEHPLHVLFNLVKVRCIVDLKYTLALMISLALRQARNLIRL